MPSTILWADDEIDLLKPHIMFLKGKGYDVVTACSGADALELAGQQNFDLIILDENMPGLTGLETLQRIKLTSPGLTELTSGPTDSTMPTISWPTVMPGFAWGTDPCRICRSDEQMLDSVTFTIASFGSVI